MTKFGALVLLFVLFVVPATWCHTGAKCQFIGKEGNDEYVSIRLHEDQLVERLGRPNPSWFYVDEVNGQQYLTEWSRYCVALKHARGGKYEPSLKLLKKSRDADKDYNGCVYLKYLMALSESSRLRFVSTPLELKLSCPSLTKAEGACTLTTDKEHEFLVKKLVTFVYDEGKWKNLLNYAVVQSDTGSCISVRRRRDTFLFRLTNHHCDSLPFLDALYHKGMLADEKGTPAKLQCVMFAKQAKAKPNDGATKKKEFLREFRSALMDRRDVLLKKPIILPGGKTVSWNKQHEKKTFFRNFAAQALLDILPIYEAQVNDPNITPAQWRDKLFDDIRCPIGLESELNDMVVASDGITYYYVNIQNIPDKKSPMTRQILKSDDQGIVTVYPNKLLMFVYKLANELLQ